MQARSMNMGLNLRRALPVFLLALGTLVLPGCAGASSASSNPVPAGQVAQVGAVAAAVKAAATMPITGTAATSTSAATVGSTGVSPVPQSAGDSVAVTLGDSITVEGPGATVNGSTVNITAAGSYTISGTLKDGQIVVDTADKEAVTLVLNGVDITSSTSAPIYIKNANEVSVVLADGSQNRITDGASYVLEDPASEEPDAAIFSKADLSISGNGALAVDANYNDAIASKDELEITSGHITIDSVSDGIRGRDNLTVLGGEITVTAGGDGLKATNDENPGKGFVSIEGGTIRLTSANDGIQAEASVLVSGGAIDISTGGGSVKAPSVVPSSPFARETASASTADQASAKGIKAVTSVTIEAGTFNIDSADDAIHSNGSLSISGGQLTLASGDDGIHSDSNLEIAGGNIAITRSYEGIESAVITINDGKIHLVSSDDGINVAGGNDGSALGGRPGQNSFSSSSPYYLHINGGYTVVDSTGDGIDANGAIEMTGGVVIVNGPTANMNGALDYDGGFKITGGTVVAAGSSGMAQAPDTSSTQNSVMVNLPAVVSGGTLVHIESQTGEELITFMPTKAFQSVVVSSPALTNGSAHVVYTGGSSTGTVTDGVYSDGTYTGGTQAATFTVSGAVTAVGTVPRAGFPGARR